MAIRSFWQVLVVLYPFSATGTSTGGGCSFKGGGGYDGDYGCRMPSLR